MKRYVPIIIGVVALCAVLYIGNKEMNSDESLAHDESSSMIASKSFQGSVMRVFEGENVLNYGFDLPETATATVAMDGALIKITDNDASVLAMYVSYEGGRGYSPDDYITNNIIPKVAGITHAGTTTIGGYDWTVVESANSQWHVASVENGNWLLVVESKKVDSEKALATLETLLVATPENPSSPVVEETPAKEDITTKEVATTTQESSR